VLALLTLSHLLSYQRFTCWRHQIRYHSFYAHHTHNGYAHLLSAHDAAWRDVLLRFQPCDLYSKGQALPDVTALRPYYARLLAEFGLDRPLRFAVMRFPSHLREAMDCAAAE
jgi:hypothetical protein